MYVLCSVCRNHNPVLSSFMTYHQVCNKSNTMGVTCGVGTAHSSRVPEIFSGVPVAGSLVFCVMVIALSVFLWFTTSDYPFDIFLFLLHIVQSFNIIFSFHFSQNLERINAQTHITHWWWITLGYGYVVSIHQNCNWLKNKTVYTYKILKKIVWTCSGLLFGRRVWRYQRGIQNP